MNRLVITPLAAADLEDIASYIAKEDPAAALRMIERLEEISILLKDHPHIGVARDDIAKGMRVFPVGNYLIPFFECSTMACKSCATCMVRENCAAWPRACFR